MAVTAIPQPLAEGDNRRKWTTEEFQRAAALGLFRPEERLELIGGEILNKMPPNPPHASLTDILADTMRQVIGGMNACVRVEKPLALGTSSQPEPDIAVVRGLLRDYIAHHPTATDVFLVIEVSDSTLTQDRTIKRDDYAAAGLPEYWIVNLVDRCVEIHRAPQNGHWQQTTIAGPADNIAPLFAPLATLPVAGMLP